MFALRDMDFTRQFVVGGGLPNPYDAYRVYK